MDLNRALAVARALARDVLAGEVDACDREARWPERSFQAMQASGLAGLVVPQEHGGLGHGLHGVARICEAFAYEFPSFALGYGMHCVGTAVIAARATESQAERFLRPIARGEHLTTLAISEPGAGVHFYYPDTTLESMPGGYLLTGTKSFATNGGHADSYVVTTVAADPDAPAGVFSCAMVGRDAEGLTWDAPYRGFGMRANAARTFHMDKVRIAHGDLLGSPGDQTWYLFNAVAPFFLASMAGTYLGIAQRAMDEATAHVQQRIHSHSGRSLAQEPVLQGKVARGWAQVERTRRLLYWATQQGDDGQPQALPGLCVAKAEVGECAVQVANEALTMGGGRAYRDSDILPRLLRDARAAHVMSPTTDMLWTWAGRALLGLPVLEE